MHVTEVHATHSHVMPPNILHKVQAAMGKLLEPLGGPLSDASVPPLIKLANVNKVSLTNLWFCSVVLSAWACATAYGELHNTRTCQVPSAMRLLCHHPRCHVHYSHAHPAPSMPIVCTVTWVNMGFTL